MYKYCLCLFLGLASPAVAHAEQTSDLAQTQSPLLPWTTDYEQALTTAKAESLPLYVFFTGSSWCIWCKKMEKELHEPDVFRQKVVGKCIFVKIDLPAGVEPSETTKSLMNRFNIRGVPTVLILSPEGKELARFRYQKISAEAYGNLVLGSLKQSS